MKNINEDYTIITLSNDIKYMLSKWHKNKDEIYNYTMIDYFPEEQLIDDDCLTFVGDGDIYYGS